MKKILNIKHHYDDYECMWNGIEDIYITITGEKIPYGFFFALSGFTNFEYIIDVNEKYKRNPRFIESNTAKLYKFLHQSVGFTYQFYDGHDFYDTLEKAKNEINNGFAVVMGALDMYELEYYPKIYHKRHIPIHYVLMIGYDDDKQCVYIYDCGKEGIESLSYESLRLAMNIKCSKLSKNNSIITIQMTNPQDIYSITIDALKRRADMFLNKNNSSYGVVAYRQFANDFDNWANELSTEEYRACLLNMIISTGTVPIIPNILLHIDKPDKVLHMGARQRINEVLSEIGEKYNNNTLICSGTLFLESGKKLQILSDKATAFLAGQIDTIEGAKELILDAAEFERQAYELLIKL